MGAERMAGALEGRCGQGFAADTIAPDANIVLTSFPARQTGVSEP